MSTLLTIDLLNEYFLERKHHIAHAETVKLLTEMRVHSDGDSPSELISERRPSEGVKVQEYREKIRQKITKGSIGKVINELGKIRKADDWKIDYSQSVKPALVTDKESLEQYCEYNYPGVESITNWVFSVLLKTYLTDANAAIVLLPLEFEVTSSTYRKPYTQIFSSEQVIEYVYQDYAVLLATEKCKYTSTDGKSTYDDGKIYYIVNAEVLQRWEQVSFDKKFVMKAEYKHALGYLPVRLTMGVFSRVKDNQVIWESRISDMLPHLNEAIREYSDLQAEIVQHMFSEKWVRAGQECTKCKGTGETLRKGKNLVGDNKIKCTECKGRGRVVNSYEYWIIDPPSPGQKEVGDPAGYIQKDVAIAKLQDERVEKHLYKALAAINFEFLHKVPMSESGIAKEVDRESLNVFVNYIAEDIVAHMDWIYKVICDMRYAVIVQNDEERKKMRPVINVPTRLDILTSGYLMDEITKAKNAKVNPIVINALELDYTNKKFSTDPLMRNLLKCQMELDPLAGLSEDDKMLRLQNKGITQEMYVVSSNIGFLVSQAYNEMKGKFFDLDYQKKVEKITALAQPIIAKTSAAAQIETEEKELEIGQNGGG